MSKNLIPTESVSVLTNLFVNLCAVNAMKMVLMSLDEEQQREVRESLIGQWKNECDKLFDQKILSLQDQVKNLKPSEKLTAAMEIDKIKDQYDFDFKFSKVIVSNLF
jgi:hypothetical protein